MFQSAALLTGSRAPPGPCGTFMNILDYCVKAVGVWPKDAGGRMPNGRLVLVCSGLPVLKVSLGGARGKCLGV